MVTAAMKSENDCFLAGKQWQTETVGWKVHNTLPTKVPIGDGLPSGAYSCESGKVMKAECQKIDAFELWCWRRILKVPWMARKSNQSILREINPELEELMLEQKLQHVGHLMRTANSLDNPWCWETLRAEGEEGIRRWDGWMASLMQWTWTWANFRRWWGTGRPGVLQSFGSQRHDWVTGQQQHSHYAVLIWATFVGLVFPLFDLSPHFHRQRVSPKISFLTPWHEFSAWNSLCSPPPLSTINSQCRVKLIGLKVSYITFK